MLKMDDTGRAVHYPANPDRFEFDAEVSRVFTDIAERSIPNFRAAHEAHVQMAAETLAKPGCKVLDVGASRGDFLKAIRQAGFNPDYTAVDSSESMCDRLREDFPDVLVLNEDITTTHFERKIVDEEYDVVCCNYVLQFLPESEQLYVLDMLCHHIKRGGYLFLGHKSKHFGQLGAAAHECYIQFRLRNGYTREEIEAKTKALKGTMFPMDHAYLMRTLQVRFAEVMETTRYMMFCSVAARK